MEPILALLGMEKLVDLAYAFTEEEMASGTALDIFSSAIGKEPTPELENEFLELVRRGTRDSAAAQNPAEAEEAERAKWLQRLFSLLDDTQAPSFEAISNSNDPIGALKMISGGRRPATLRARVRSWECYVCWLRARRGNVRAERVTDITDYLMDLVKKPCGRSTLKSTWEMFRYVESVSGLCTELCFSETGLAKRVYEGVLAEAVAGATGRRTGQAPRLLVSLLKDAECRIGNASEHPYTRMLCWYVCVSSWAILRYHDHRGLVPGTLVEQGPGWQMGIGRSKTIGSDKAVENTPTPRPLRARDLEHPRCHSRSHVGAPRTPRSSAVSSRKCSRHRAHKP